VTNGYTWTPTSKPISYSSWAPGQPDKRNGNENCLLATFKNSDAENAVTWSDENCDEKFKYVCE
jgi:hypothetical protein